MTNNPTIDGVSRELLEQSEAAFKALLKQITEEDEDGDYWRVRFESRRDQLRALLDAPVVERHQPFAWFTDDYLTDKSSTTYDEITSARWKDKGWSVQPLYAAPPEVAALQSTIAQLQARIAELESGKVSALTDGVKTLERIGVSIKDRQQRMDELFTAPPAPVAVLDKYDEVLLPFLTMMRNELHANAGKGDRPGWLSMTPGECLLEIYYHLGKLQKGVKDGNELLITEYSADVANMAMMLADICGCLDTTAALNEVRK